MAGYKFDPKSSPNGRTYFAHLTYKRFLWHLVIAAMLGAILGTVLGLVIG